MIGIKSKQYFCACCVGYEILSSRWRCLYTSSKPGNNITIFKNFKPYTFPDCVHLALYRLICLLTYLCIKYFNDGAVAIIIYSTPCFRKKTSTRIIGYKLKNSCLILIIFDNKIPETRCTVYLPKMEPIIFLLVSFKCFDRI